MSIHDVLAGSTVRTLFQPIVDLDTGAVVAYEALTRGPEGSALSEADDLFAAAREHGVLADLDRLCRTTAFRAAVTQGLRPPLSVFINLEPEVLDGATVDDLRDLAAEVPDHVRIVVEITERSLANRPAQLLATLERVRSLGWGVALDDVGAAAASLAFMPFLQPDVVKLDLAVVQDKPSPVIAEIVNAVNDHAERTGATLLAEGIETPEHLASARAMGARLGQGWFFGRPREGAAARYPVGGLRLVAHDLADAPDGGRTPFGCLPPGTPVRRASKELVLQLTQQLERQAMRLGDTCVVAVAFQHAEHLTPATARRYRDLVDGAGFVFALGQEMPPAPVPGLRGGSLGPGSPLVDEWDIVVVSPHFAGALLAREVAEPEVDGAGAEMDRLFDFTLTYRRETVVAAARSLLSHVDPTVARVPEPAPTVGTAGSTRAAPAAPSASARERWSSRALASSSTGLAVADARRTDQPLVFVNETFEELSGYAAADLLGRNCRFLQGEDTDPAAVARLRSAVAAGRECTEVLVNYRGVERTPWWNELRLLPIFDDAGRLEHYLGVQRDVTELVEATAAAEHERTRAEGYRTRTDRPPATDPVTGLMSRRRFAEKVEARLWESTADADALALVHVDLDGFTEVNDRWGHDVGDELLQEVATRMLGRIRRHDLITRLGADEFWVVAPGLAPGTARLEARRLAAKLAAAIAEPYHLDGGAAAVSITARTGTSLHPEDAQDLPQLVRLARRTSPRP